MEGENKQALGPRQEAWVAALESGKFQQGHHFLTDGKSYCCLGVAATLTDRPHRYPLLSDFEFLPGAPDRLVVMNDDQNMTFQEIAAALRANPELYFAEPI